RRRLPLGRPVQRGARGGGRAAAARRQRRGREVRTMAAPRRSSANRTKAVQAIRHEDKRVNNPTADAFDLVTEEVEQTKTLLYPRDPSLDPQLVWKGKDEQDRQDLEVPAPPI